MPSLLLQCSILQGEKGQYVINMLSTNLEYSSHINMQQPPGKAYTACWLHFTLLFRVGKGWNNILIGTNRDTALMKEDRSTQLSGVMFIFSAFFF